MIRTGFIDRQDTAVNTFDEPQAVTRIDKAFHIERAMLFPFLKICETVQISGFIESKTVQVAMIDDLAVCCQRDFFNTVDIGGIIHIVVTFYRQSYLSPCLDLSCQCLFAVLGGDGL